MLTSSPTRFQGYFDKDYCHKNYKKTNVQIPLEISNFSSFDTRKNLQNFFFQFIRIEFSCNRQQTGLQLVIGGGHLGAPPITGPLVNPSDGTIQLWCPMDFRGAPWCREVPASRTYLRLIYVEFRYGPRPKDSEKEILFKKRYIQTIHCNPSKFIHFHKYIDKDSTSYPGQKIPLSNYPSNRSGQTCLR